MMIPELVRFIVGLVNDPPDLLNYACVNKTWSMPALQKLYTGSINDLRYRTPNIGSLNSLFIASRERFARNMSFVKHLVIAPEQPAERSYCEGEYCSMKKCRPLRTRQDTKLFLKPQGRGPVSLAIPFKIEGQDLNPASDLLLHPRLQYLALDYQHCYLIEIRLEYSQESSVPPVSPLQTECYSMCRLTLPPEIAKAHCSQNLPRGLWLESRAAI